MDTKAAFEKFREWWFAEEQAELRLNFAEGWGFRVWQASRAEIEIDLPQRQSLCASGYGDGYFVPSSTGDGLEYDEVVESITSHGIRIKGSE